MKTWRFLLAVGICSLWGLLPGVAQSDAVFLGIFAEPFTTHSVTGELSYPGELDWYAFAVESDVSTVHLLCGGEDVSGIRMVVFDDQGAHVGTSEDETLTVTLNAGTYRVRVDSLESAAQDYSLVVSTGAETEPNDGILESDALGSFTDTVLVIGSLLPRGDADFFGFEVPEGVNLQGVNAFLLETHGPSLGDTVLVLYRYSDSEQRYLPVMSDDDAGEDYWSRLLLPVVPGDRYAVRVEETAYPLDGIEQYALVITPLTLTADQEPNNTVAEAVALEPVSPTAATWTAEGLLDVDDSIDFYQLTLDVPALLQVWTESQSHAGGYDSLLSLYTSGGDLLAANDDSGDSLWSHVVVPLDAGSYSITVEAATGDAWILPYRLRAVVRDVTRATESEPNESPDTAQVLDWAGGEATLIEAAIGQEGDIDAFRFTLDEKATVVFETGPMPGSTTDSDTTLSLYDEDLSSVAYNDDANGSWSRIEETLEAGTYYIIVESYFSDSSFEYMLLVTEPRSSI